jgi:hypothetical protein
MVTSTNLSIAPPNLTLRKGRGHPRCVRSEILDQTLVLATDILDYSARLNVICNASGHIASTPRLAERCGLLKCRCFPPGTRARNALLGVRF